MLFLEPPTRESRASVQDGGRGTYLSLTSPDFGAGFRQIAFSYGSPDFGAPLGQVRDTPEGMC